MRTPAALALAALTAFVSGCGRSSPPYDPRESQTKFQLPPGFRIELAAAEPEVVDPIAVAFDERGRMWVVEMGDYPLSQEPRGKIKVLEDRDGDGRFEHATVFADHLHFPHGVLPWKNGVLVTSAPDILYLEDTDGDGRADLRKVVLTGFAQVNPQLRVNTPLYGIDNWIYAAYPRFGRGVRFKEFSDLGQPIRFPDHPEIPPVDIFSKGMDIRFKPDQLRLEGVSGNSEFGLAMDARGHRFPSWNDKHAQQAVIENAYLARNPYLAAGSAVASMSDHGDSAEVYPITEHPVLKDIRDPRVMFQLGHFTSACGQSVYAGGDFPAQYEGAYFICEPVSNLVHCDRLQARGATFTASRVREKAEFLASKDAWFMPVFTSVGPDGALYVVDFYRKIVEHPEWIRKDRMHDHKLFDAGNDRGRIWRVVAEGSKPAPRPKLHEASTAQLVDQLGNRNMWWRITAQRLLVQKQDRSAVPALENLARTGSPEARMHALWTLEGLGALEPELVLAGLNDASPAVREQAVRLAETFLGDPQISARLARMTEEPDGRVQFQVACTLGQLPPAKSFQPLHDILARNVEDPWFQIAAMTAARDNAGQWFRSFIADAAFTKTKSDGKEALLRRIGSVIGARQNNQEIQAAAGLMRATPRAASAGDWWQAASLRGLAEGVARGATGRMKLAPGAQQALLALAEDKRPEIARAALEVAANVQLSDSAQLRSLVSAASKVIGNESAPPALRANAATTLGLDPAQSRLPLLNGMLNPRQPEEVQLAAARALLQAPEPKAVESVLQHWNSFTPAIREAVISGIFRHPANTALLINALEAGTVRPASLDRGTRQRLLRAGDEGIRKRAQAMLANFDQNRAGVIEKFRGATKQAGNVERGREVYRKTCSECHRVGDMGIKVGPDLATVTNQAKEDLLTNILDPSANIAPGYEEYAVKTTDGSLITGVIANQSATSVTLRRRKGEEDVVLRANIAEMRASTVSPMPENLEEGLTVDQFADLLEFLKNQPPTHTAEVRHAN